MLKYANLCTHAQNIFPPLSRDFAVKMKAVTDGLIILFMKTGQNNGRGRSESVTSGLYEQFIRDVYHGADVKRQLKELFFFKSSFLLHCLERGTKPMLTRSPTPLWSLRDLIRHPPAW